MIGVDLDARNAARGAEPDDRPVVAGAATASRFPSVAHVLGAAGHDHVVAGAEMHVAGAEDEAAVQDGREVERRGRPVRRAASRSPASP